MDVSRFQGDTGDFQLIFPRLVQILNDNTFSFESFDEECDEDHDTDIKEQILSWFKEYQSQISGWLEELFFR